MATQSSRRPSSSSSSSSSAEDKKESSWPMSWLIGGGVIGTITVILGIIIYKLLFAPEVEPFQPQAMEAGMECTSMQHEECMDDLVCIKAMEAVAEIKASNTTVATPAQDKGKFYCKAKVKPGLPCPSMQHDECTDDAMCVVEKYDTRPYKKHKGELIARTKGTYYCKAMIGAECIRNECLDSSTFGGIIHNELQTGCVFDAESAMRCEVVPKVTTSTKGKEGARFEGWICNEDFSDFCKAVEGMPCGSPRKTAINWCGEDLECVTDGSDWTCKKPATNGAEIRKSAQIQLGETTHTWHVVNRSRLMQSNNLRKKRTQTSGFLQVDSD